MRTSLIPSVVLILVTHANAASPILVSKADPASAASLSASGPSQQPLISSNGQVIVFNSAAPDLVAPSSNRWIDDVFVRDLAANTLTRISTRLDGTSGGNGSSRVVQVSRNGRFVLFISEASDLVANDTNEAPDVFLHDRQTHTTQLISVAPDGVTPGNAASSNPSMSDDASRIVFDSFASNLVTNDSNSARDVFIRDLQTGITTRLSTNPSGSDSLGGNSEAVAISPDGQRVAYLTTTTNIVEPDTPRYQRLLIHELATHSTVAIPRPPGDVGSTVDIPLPQVTWSDNSSRMMIEYTSFRRLFSFQFGTGANPSDTLQSAIEGTRGFGAWTLSGNGTLGAHSLSNLIHLWDFKGPSTPWMVESPGNPPSPLRGWAPQLDANASRLFFISDSNDLDPQANDSRPRLYAANLATKQIRSIAPLANAGHSAPPRPFDVSDDGSKVVFESVATDVLPSDRNGFPDIFLADLTSGTLTLISQRMSIPTASTAIGQSRIEPRGLSDDGRIALFSSTAADLVPGDLNHAQDLFAIDLDTQALQLVSRSLDGKGTGSHMSYSGSLSGNGRYAAFISTSTNLIPDDPHGLIPKLFLRDLVSQSTRLVSTNAARLPTPVFANDGSALVFVSTDTEPKVNLYDPALNTQIELGIAKSRGGEEILQVSKTGSDIAYFATVSNGNGVQLLNRATGASRSLVIGSFPQSGVFQLSADGQSILYSGKTGLSPATQILQGIPGKPPKILSVAPDGTTPARGECLEPALDETGRYLVFTSIATNLVQGTSPFISQVFVRDLQTGTTRLVSLASDGRSPGNQSSRSPTISANGRHVLFWSRATNLIDDDTNGSGDFFVRDLYTGTTQIIGRTATLAAEAKPSSAWLSRDGGRVVFNTFEDAFGALDLNRSSDVYAYRLEPDVDADGMDDVWEAEFGIGASLEPDDDTDQDGISNRDEFIANTSPSDPNSFTRIQAERASDGSVGFRWKGESNRGYRIQSTLSLSAPTWELENFAALGAGSLLQWSPPSDAASARFYRLLIVH